MTTASAAAAVLHELSPMLGARITDKRGARQQHSEDMSHFSPRLPDLVAFPESTKEVQAIVKACAQHNLPVIPYGVGTSMEGHVLAIRGGITVDMSRMNEVLCVNEQDLDVAVQSGVTRVQLNDYLRDTGLFFPIDPGADATIGGMAATRASGTNAVRYGTMRENVLSLTVVLPDGRAIVTARRARKSSAGYDLTRLFIGAEGTLGIITEVTLRVYGRPEVMSAATCGFESMEGAVAAVIETIQLGIPIARIEFLDEASVDVVNRYSALDLPVCPTLFLEFHGSEAGARDQVEMVAGIVAAHGGKDFQWAESPEEHNRLWQARHDAAHAVTACYPGTKQWWTDVCVPISRLADCILETQRDIDDTGLPGPIVGHVGDGNFHVGICAAEDDDEQYATAEALHQRLVERALAMGGTCTGEHGIGMGKIEFLEQELGAGVDLMRSIKKAIDPQNIMNPGKIFRHET